LLSVNGLAAANEVFVAVQTEFFALQGMSKLVEVVQLVRRRMHPGLAITGIVPCLYDVRLRLAREVLAEIRKYFPGLVFERTIAKSVKLAEAPSFGQTILQYASESSGAKDYRALAREVIAREEPGHAELRAPLDEALAEIELVPAQRESAPTAPSASSDREQDEDLPELPEGALALPLGHAVDRAPERGAGPSS
jgi:nitrogenase subunit NifH